MATTNLFSIKTLSNPGKKSNGVIVNVTSNHNTIEDLDDRRDHDLFNHHIEDKYLKEMSNSIHNSNDSIKQHQVKKRGNETNLKTDNSKNDTTRKQKQLATNGKQLSHESESSRIISGRNGILVKAVTVDHSKDYTSSSSEDENSFKNGRKTAGGKLLSTSELILNSNSSLQDHSPTTSTNGSDSKHHHRFIKNMFLLNDYNTDKTGRIPSLSKTNSYNNSSLDEDQSNVLVAPLDLQTPTRHLSVNSNNINQTFSTKTNGNSDNRSKEEFDEEPTDSASDEQHQQNQNLDEHEIRSDLDLSIFDLLDKTSKKFVLKPATLGLNIRCQIYRQKGLYPKYRFYMENLDGNLLLLMTARKKKKTKTPCYVISTLTYDLDNLEKYIETPIAKLKSNLLGTYFRLYDFGVKPSPVVANGGNGKKLSRSSSLFRNNFTGSSNNLGASHTFLPNNSSTANIGSLSLSKQDSDLSDNCDESRLNWTAMDSKDVSRKEFVSLFYELNMLGFKV
jgi:hypothetical protein